MALGVGGLCVDGMRMAYAFASVWPFPTLEPRTNAQAFVWEFELIGGGANGQPTKTLYESQVLPMPTVGPTGGPPSAFNTTFPTKLQLDPNK